MKFRGKIEKMDASRRYAQRSSLRRHPVLSSLFRDIDFPVEFNIRITFFLLQENSLFDKNFFMNAMNMDDLDE